MSLRILRCAARSGLRGDPPDAAGGLRDLELDVGRAGLRAWAEHGGERCVAGDAEELHHVLADRELGQAVPCEAVLAQAALLLPPVYSERPPRRVVRTRRVRALVPELVRLEARILQRDVEDLKLAHGMARMLAGRGVGILDDGPQQLRRLRSWAHQLDGANGEGSLARIDAAKAGRDPRRERLRHEEAGHLVLGQILVLCEQCVDLRAVLVRLTDERGQLDEQPSQAHGVTASAKKKSPGARLLSFRVGRGRGSRERTSYRFVLEWRRSATTT